MTITQSLRDYLLAPRANSTVIATLLCGLVLLIATTILIFGVQPSGDVDRYIDRGNRLWSDWISADRSINLISPWDLFYLLPNLYISALVRWHPAHAVVLAVLGNAILYSALVMVVMRTWLVTKPIGAHLLLVVVTLFLFFGLPGEITKYLGLYHSSDIMFLCLSGFALTAVARSQLRPRLSITFAAMLFAAACVFTRPPGIVTFLAVFCGISLGSFYTSRRFVICTAGASLLISLFVWPYYIYHLLADGADADARTGMGYVLYNYKYGVIVSGYDVSYMDWSRVYLDYVWITFLRLVYYLIPLRPDFSALHIISNSCYLGVFVYLFARGCQHLSRGGRQGQRLLLTLSLYILWMALFHAMTQVEDWRYELPIWPALWLVAGYGLPPPRLTSHTG